MVKTNFATELNRKHFLKLLGAFFAGIDNELNLSVYCEKSLVQFLFIHLVFIVEQITEIDAGFSDITVADSNAVSIRIRFNNVQSQKMYCITGLL